MAGRSPEFFPLPRPDLALWLKLSKREQSLNPNFVPRSDDLQNDIGPFELEGRALWFAPRFYGGEGSAGLGAIGSFGADTLRYEMRYLADVAPYAGTAIRLDGDYLWLGLGFWPEGSMYGVGLLRFNRKSGETKTFPLPAPVRTIDRLGDTVVAGTDLGIWALRDGALTQYRIEPESGGRLGVLTRTITNGGGQP